MSSQPLVRLSGNRLITTSLAVSNHFGKKHAHVLRDIENLDCSDEFRESNFGLSSYTTSQNKKLPMYEITRDGFVFLCMGFTGTQAAQWKEKYIAAFNAMEAELSRPRAPQGMPDLAADMRLLAQGMAVVLQQNQLTHRYIDLLERNQKSRARISPDHAVAAKKLVAAGLSQSQAARELGISKAAVNALVNDKYEFGGEWAKPSPMKLLQQQLDDQRNVLIEALQIAEKGE
ncbi:MULTISPECIES: Rha family transcriptional regulator [unclassified Neisseria]|uniref:Rha family transcriptional regulator n=1 Tax=unclassified Neisseria TaxID=2623750 RepID=UPI00142FF648|nr:MULTISPECIES: Rha family transcriptional regulator [unclassified Neisseria]MBF0802916.1 Rha family transcriptional regulator [Neisseria sp. 19428wB4_WF04]